MVIAIIALLPGIASATDLPVDFGDEVATYLELFEGYDYEDEMKEIISDPRNQNLYNEVCADLPNKTGWDCTEVGQSFWIGNHKVTIKSGEHGISWALERFIAENPEVIEKSRDPQQPWPDNPADRDSIDSSDITTATDSAVVIINGPAADSVTENTGDTQVDTSTYIDNDISTSPSWTPERNQAWIMSTRIFPELFIALVIIGLLCFGFIKYWPRIRWGRSHKRHRGRRRSYPGGSTVRSRRSKKSRIPRRVRIADWFGNFFGRSRRVTLAERAYNEPPPISPEDIWVEPTGDSAPHKPAKISRLPGKPLKPPAEE